MRERLQVVISTVVVFALGIGTGVLTQQRRPVPPLPIAPMGEFVPPMGWNAAPLPPLPGTFHPGGALNFGEMRRQIEALQPQIEAYRASVQAIETKFRSQLEAMLNADQRHALAEFERFIIPGTDKPFSSTKEPFERMSGFQGPPPPLFPGCAFETNNMFVPMVIYRPQLDRLTQVLQLNAQQHDQLKMILVERRTKLLELLDQNPPPSFRLATMFLKNVMPGFPPASNRK